MITEKVDECSAMLTSLLVRVSPSRPSTLQVGCYSWAQEAAINVQDFPWPSQIRPQQPLKQSLSLVPKQADAKLVSKHRGIRFIIRPVHTFNRGMKNCFPTCELKRARMAREQAGKKQGAANEMIKAGGLKEHFFRSSVCV